MQLLSDLNCSVLMTTDKQFAPVRELLSERESLTVIELKPLNELLNEPQPVYNFDKKLRGMESQTAFAVHTSGSTGQKSSRPDTTYHGGHILIHFGPGRLPQTNAYQPRIYIPRGAKYRIGSSGWI